MKYDIEEIKEYLFSPNPQNIEVAFTIAPKQCEEYCSQFQWLVDLGKINKCREAFSLTRLDLWGSKLTELPESIGSLSNLRELDLGYNQLTKLPDSTGNLTNLKELKLYDNQLTQLPDWISNLPNLTWLDLEDNQLTQLPDWIGKLNNLTDLDLEDNPIPKHERQRIKKALPNCRIYF